MLSLGLLTTSPCYWVKQPRLGPKAEERGTSSCEPHVQQWQHSKYTARATGLASGSGKEVISRKHGSLSPRKNPLWERL